MTEVKSHMYSLDEYLQLHEIIADEAIKAKTDMEELNATR